MGIKEEIYNPVLDDDLELVQHGGKYKNKFALLQVTVRLPEYSLVNWIAVLYGFLPFVIGFAYPIGYAVTQRFVFVYGIILCIVGMSISEIFLKPVFKDPRPPETANRYPDGRVKYGFPSGHCLTTVALMVWTTLEIQFQDELNKPWLVATLACCLPVPWARMHNRDHSFKQVVAGSFIGAVVGAVGFMVRIKHYRGHWFPWELDLFTNNEMYV